MARKFFTLAPVFYYTKQLASGGRNEIPAALLVCGFTYWLATSFGVKQGVEPHVKQMKVNNSTWI